MTRVLFVTGASRGIGRAIAERGVARGFVVGALARDGAALAALAADHPAGSILPLPCDVRDADAVAAAVAELDARAGAPQLVVHAAGVLGPVGPAWEARGPELADAIATSAVGCANVAAATVPAMRAAGAGALVAISASAATRVFRGWAAYAAAKAALDAYIRNLAAEVGQEPGIVVFSFVPGLTRTRLQEELLALDEDRFPDVRRFRRWHAMGAAKEPERVAEILEAVLAGPRDGLNGSVVDAEEFERERRRALLGTR